MPLGASTPSGCPNPCCGGRSVGGQSVNVAGYGRESNKQSGTSRLLLVGTREQAVDLITAISPLGAHQVTSPAWDVLSPKRARIPSPIDASSQALSLSPIPAKPLRRTDQTATVWSVS